MKQEELKKVYSPVGEQLDIRVKNTLNTLAETSLPRMNVRKAAALAVCVAMLATACVGAAGVLFSNEYDAVRLAHRALAAEYGVTEEMQTFFAKRVTEENGVTTVVFSGMTGLSHVLGEYTVVIRDGEAEASWSKDGESTDGGLEAHAWGAGQIEILLDMAKRENGIFRGYQKAQEIRVLMDEEDLTVSVGKGGSASVVALEGEQLEKAIISVSEEEAIAIAKQAFAAEYGLTAKQLDMMSYEKDYAGYTYAIRDGKTICEVWFWLHQDENVVHTQGDGLYFARINAETGVVEEIVYDSALAGNG